jgi:DNA (cytosine-5)-methyltransferase 1
MYLDMAKTIPIIDLFAGPGGLGEGFSSHNSGRAFTIRLSIEKDTHAHNTLELRAFYRQFAGKPHKDYYKYIAGELTREELFKRHPDQATAARNHAWKAELGSPRHPPAQVDRRIRQALGDDSKDWVLIGGPPCQAYSLVGRSRMRGTTTNQIKEFEADRRHYLYRHYLRILAVHQPAVFVMENVKGLLSAKVKEQRIIESILRDLKNPEIPNGTRNVAPVRYNLYSLVTNVDPGENLNPEDFVVRSEKYGIPQARHRIIFLGIRSDLPATPKTLVPADEVFTVKQAISDLPPLRSGLSKEGDGTAQWESAVSSSIHEKWLRESSVEQKVRKAIRKAVQNLRTNLTRGKEFFPGSPLPRIYRNWFVDEDLAGFCNHTTRGHIRGDLHRYLFAAAYAEVNGNSPGLEQYPVQLLPDHKNVTDALIGSKFNDRFRVQIANRPSTTVTCHISKDGHYFIHYDPTQCRSLTVREAARLQTFPDNYFFEGPRTEQYKQVGNAVPPLLARRIAEIVARVLK